MLEGDYINWAPGTTLEMVEKWTILKAFRFYRGNKTATANALGIAVRTLDNKLEKYQADDKIQKERDENARIEREKFAARQRGIKPPPGTEGISKANLHSPYAGLSMESASKSSEESTMPVPKRKEVQSVSPEHSAQGGQSRRR